MTKAKRITLSAVCVLLAAAVTAGWILMNPLGAGAASVVNYSYDSDVPFFNDFWDSRERHDENSIDRWFDTLGPTDNDSNFASLGTVSYANINGGTVTVDVFNRNNGDTINDPNFGEGMLIYQCIQYKIAHPEESVEIYFSSYRTSVTAAVCVDRDSRYFGYMRSLFDEEYDEHGFVRIMFMLVEAARMGIKVVFVPQLNSYGTYQNDPSASKGYSIKDALLYKTYVNSALNKSCYSRYANGKKISDFFNYKQVNWNIAQRQDDMHHIKCCLASHYLDKDGNTHRYGAFFTSANLDEVDYLGRNGNTGSQSGVIVSGHKDIYDVTKNYLELIVKYRTSNNIAKFRLECGRLQTEQFDLIKAGRRNEIPENKRIVYLGSENDPVFEMYFTPLPGPVGVWDTTYNPYCRYLSEMLDPDEGTPIVFTWTMPYNQCSNYFEYAFEDVICEAFHKNKNPENRIYMHFESFSEAKYNDLVVGRDIGFKAVNTNLKTYLHAKDMILSYVKDGQRKYISIISSCNFGMTPFWYRSNSVLVIKETDANHGVYTTLGAASSFGAITKND